MNKFKSLYVIYKILPLKIKITLFVSIFVVLLSSSFEYISIGIVSQIFKDPSLLIQSVISFIQYFLPDSLKSLINPLQAIAIILVFFLSIGILKTLNVWLSIYISKNIGIFLGRRAFTHILSKQYDDFKTLSVPFLIDFLTIHLSRSVAAISAFIQLITSSFLVIALLLSVYSLYGPTSIYIFLACFISYSLISRYTSPILKSNSKKFTLNSKLIVKTLQDTLLNIKEVLLKSRQYTQLNRYDKLNVEIRDLQAKNVFMSSAPRHPLDTVVITSLVGYILFTAIMQSSSSLSLFAISDVPILLIVFQKIVPSLQQSYSSFSVIQSRLSSLGLVSDFILSSNKYHSVIYSVEDSPGPSSFSHIAIKNVSYCYKDTSFNVLKNLNCHLNLNSNVGIVGESGSGKSTFLNILLGLSRPTSGSITLDGIDIWSNPSILAQYRRFIGYVPQDSTFTQVTIVQYIVSPISFDCYPTNDISYDSQKLDTVLRVSCLDDFINSCASGIHTSIGERGSSLSGGQLQRLNLARALYHDPKLLILDEFTSALDSRSKEHILNAIQKLNIPYVIVTHDQSVLRICRDVFEIRAGQLRKI